MGKIRIVLILLSAILLFACGASEEEVDYNQMPAQVPLEGDGDLYASVIVDSDTLEFEVKPGKVEGAALIATCFAEDTEDEWSELTNAKGVAKMGGGWLFQTYAPQKCDSTVCGKSYIPVDKNGHYGWYCESGVCECTSYLQMLRSGDAQITTLRIKLGLDCENKLFLLDEIKVSSVD